ncbi:hypothetical protein [Mahella australiensis]|uniref:Uncharacterized protein n=1 Tax=Mahella australiensis (strain DSM 15567 / CIP 107919 / 50-1 BON) TaxID=697281 RepID=F4A355_MAHA5|nr:hypothetical protein [Mahella australiensis]AEE96288.1 hypothetical protein Mahau_1090 [Mahella australiensis 50-1 BON]
MDEWIIPIIILIGIMMSLIGDRNTKKNNDSKKKHVMPPPPPPKSAFKPAPASADKATVIAVSATSLPKQPESVPRQTTISNTRCDGDDFKLRVRGGELKRAMVMMEVLGPPKSEKHRR